MIAEETIARLRCHAGPPYSEDVVNPSIRRHIYEVAKITPVLEQAFDDYISVLCDLNLQMNGPVPSESLWPDNNQPIPRSVVFYVHEVQTTLRQSEREANGDTVEWFAQAAWCAEFAWSCVLHGDIDNIREDMGHSFAWAFEGKMQALGPGTFG